MQDSGDDDTVLTSSHWGALRARPLNGRIASVTPFAKDPNPSPILNGLAAAFDHPTRIRRPAIRESWVRHGVGARPELRGTEPFVEVPWDEALDIVAEQLRDARDRFGNSSIFGGSQGWSSAGRFHHAKTQLARFLNSFGGFTDQINGYSFAAATVLLPHLVGNIEMLFGPSTSWTAIRDHAELIVSFGGFPLKNAQVLSGGPGEHLTQGWVSSLGKNRPVRIVSVSPISDDLPADVIGDWWPVVPGTDTALILAMCHTLLERGLHDRAFLDRCTVGFAEVERYLLTGRGGAPFDAEWAAGVTQIGADAIRELAVALCRGRSFINVTWSLQRSDHGEQTFWAAMTLAAMVGQIGLPGGGIGFGYGSDGGTVGNPIPKVKAPTLSSGNNPTGSYIPASRVSDLLLRPGETLEYNGKRIILPETRVVYWAGGSPFHHHQDLHRLVAALRRPHAFIVHENFWTPTARHADVVLPATTPFERNDLGASSGSRILMAMKRVVPPFAEARNDHDIFVDLAERLGCVEAFTEGLDESGWLRRLYETPHASAEGLGITMPRFDEFWAAGYFEYPWLREPFVSFAQFRADPAAAPLSTPSGRIELFSERVSSFGYSESPGHAVWNEPREWLGAPLARRFPLHLISNQPRSRLHGQLDPVGVSHGSKISGREPARLNPADAARRGIKDGDIIRLFNDRGSCLAGAILSDALRPGVVQLSTGAWFDPCDPKIPGSLDRHGNPNVLTHDFGTSRFTQGPAAQSVLVEIERFDGPLPEITVHGPPRLIPN